APAWVRRARGHLSEGVEAGSRTVGGPGPRPSSDRVAAALSRADTDDAVDGGHPDLPVADLARAGGLDDGVDDLVREGVVGDDLHPDLRHEVDGVLRTAVDLGVALLAAVAL